METVKNVVVIDKKQLMCDYKEASLNYWGFRVDGNMERARYWAGKADYIFAMLVDDDPEMMQKLLQTNLIIRHNVEQIRGGY